MTCILLTLNNMFMVQYCDFYVYWRSYDVSKITNVKVNISIILKVLTRYFCVAWTWLYFYDSPVKKISIEERADIIFESCFGCGIQF